MFNIIFPLSLYIYLRKKNRQPKNNSCNSDISFLFDLYSLTVSWVLERQHGDHSETSEKSKIPLTFLLKNTIFADYFAVVIDSINFFLPIIVTPFLFLNRNIVIENFSLSNKKRFFFIQFEFPTCLTLWFPYISSKKCELLGGKQSVFDGYAIICFFLFCFLHNLYENKNIMPSNSNRNSRLIIVEKETFICLLPCQLSRQNNFACQMNILLYNFAPKFRYVIIQLK